MPRRILGLELLRGLCALIVVTYHCLWWTDIAHLPSWGRYGVYIFFGISGAVLYCNYHDRLSLTPKPGELSIPRFLFKRFARLAPLFAACILVPAVIHNHWVPDQDFLNISLLFGFGVPGKSAFLTGGWSLGIEFVLYALFPVLLAYTRNIRLMMGALAVFLVLRMTFVNFILRGTDTVQAWPLYIQPASFLVFFFGGMVIAQVMQKIRIGSLPLLGVGIACALGLFLFPGAIDEDVLLGVRGLGYTVLTVVIVGAFFWSPTFSLGAKVSQFFGDISYGLYLLHPIAWTSTQRDLPAMTPVVHILVTLGLSVAAAWLSLKFYERPLRSWIIGLASRETKEGVKKLAG